MHTWLKLAIGGMSLAIGFASGLLAILRDDPEPDVPHPTPYSGALDDVQYFAPGEDFKLPPEAAGLKRYAAEQQRVQR